MRYKEITELCQVMHEETIFKKLRYVPERLIEFVKYLEDNDNGLVLTIGDPIIGIFCGEVYPHIYSDELVAVDQLLYVHPSYRRGGIARDFVEKYKDWAKRKGAKMTMIGSSTDFKGAEEFFKSVGFDRVGGNYGLW